MSIEHTPLSGLVVATAALCGGILDLKKTGHLELDPASDLALRRLMMDALLATEAGVEALKKEHGG